MNTMVRNIVAGAGTLRFVTALVLSASVTTAVAGPMAYRAVGARNEAASLGSAASATKPDTNVSPSLPRVTTVRSVLGLTGGVPGRPAVPASAATSADTSRPLPAPTIATR